MTDTKIIDGIKYKKVTDDNLLNLNGEIYIKVGPVNETNSKKVLNNPLFKAMNGLGGSSVKILKKMSENYVKNQEHLAKQNQTQSKQN